jgi:hypothetical protein
MYRLMVICGLFVVLAGSFNVVAADSGKIEGVKAALTKQIDAAPNATDKVKGFAKERLLPLCTNPVFVREVKAQNAKKTPLSEIQALDKQWSAAEDELPIQKDRLSNACAKEAKRVAEELKVVTEIFVMDNQGANVGQNEMTSDYWQGDEPKWQNSYKGGQGGVDVSDRKFDKSANAEDQKISLPIIDEAGAVIGAVCIGLKADKI